MAHEFDHVAAGVGPSVENLLFKIDRKPVIAAANGAWAAAVDAATQLDPTARHLILDPYGAGAFDMSGGDHGAPNGMLSFGPAPGSASGANWKTV